VVNSCLIFIARTFNKTDNVAEKNRYMNASTHSVQHELQCVFVAKHMNTAT